MKKTYIKPMTQHAAMDMFEILAGSQVKTGGTPQGEYTESDVTYSRQQNVWEEEGADDF